LEYVFDRFVRQIGYAAGSGLAKLVVWGIAVFVVVLLNLSLVYGIKRLFNRYFDEINDMGRKYPRIERYFIYSTIIILAAIGAVHFAFVISDFTADYSLPFNIFTLFALAIQLSFLIMLFRLTWLRDSLKSKDRENLSLAAYSSGLEKNIDDIRNLKHDIKNIFLTMANFIEKSGDEDMKAFYRDKINPFADDAIQKNDLYAKLSKIGEERLKAFLFYKISQIIERGVALEIEIAPYFNSETGLEFTDLIRILGILLDNAAEECMTLQNGTIHVKLSLNDELVSYTIRNSVRPETREKGIRPGVSSKGGQRGRGLVIIQEIIGRYEQVALNSYFSHGEFVQGLICYR
jgi:sensor histidine kinase YesM